MTPSSAIKFVRAVIKAFLLGLRECRGSVGMTYDDPWSTCSLAYDRGRSLGCWLWRIP